MYFLSGKGVIAALPYPSKSQHDFLNEELTRVHLKFAMSKYAYYDSTKSSHLDKQSAVSALEEDF